MASFRDGSEDFQRLDYALLQNGAVTLYWRPEYLREDAAWLAAHDYRLHDIDASKWRSEADMHDALARELAFPDHYGANLDALADCLGDLPVPETGGLALLVRGLDAFSRQESRLAHALLDIAARASRGYLLSGRRFVVLVQSDDPHVEFGALGGTSAQWNRREWLTASRDPRAAT